MASIPALQHSGDRKQKARLATGFGATSVQRERSRRADVWHGAGTGRGMVKTSAAIKRPSGMKSRFAPSEVNAGFLFPPSGLRPPSRVPMKKMRAFFSWEPRPPPAGEGIFLCGMRNWAAPSGANTGFATKRDRYWVYGKPPSGADAGFFMHPSGLRPPSPASGGRDFLCGMWNWMARQAINADLAPSGINTGAVVKRRKCWVCGSRQAGWS